MSEIARADLPSAFVVHWSAALADRVRAPRRALDVAMGRGRHALALASAGYRVYGVDVKIDAVRDAVQRAAARGFLVRGWAGDLTRPALPSDSFDLILVTRYLQRDLFPSLRDALARGGFIVYETFTERQRDLGWGPASADHLLQPGELRSYFDGFDVLFDEEVHQPEAVARIVARKPPR
jgi:SAM-dependent methyltransferase